MFKKSTRFFSSSKRLSLLLLFFTLLSVTSCKDGFDEYWQFEEEKEGFLIAKLQENPQFSSFLRALERTELTQTLNQAGVYTVFAPTNAAFQNFLTARGTTLEQINVDELKSIVNYHLAYFTFYHYDFQIRYKRNPSANNSTYYLNRGYKYLKVVTDPNSNETFKVNDVNVSIRDIGAENGVIHGIDAVLQVPLSIDEKIATTPDFSTFSKLLKVIEGKVADPRNTFDKNGDGIVDSVFIRFHPALRTTSNPIIITLEASPTFGNSAAVIQQLITGFPVVNSTLDPYLAPILPSFYNRIDSLPVQWVGFLLQQHFLENNNRFVWDGPMPSVLSPTAPLKTLSTFAMSPTLVAADLATPTPTMASFKNIEVSNGILHGIKKVLESSRINSAVGKAMLDPDLKFFIEAMNKANLMADYAQASKNYTIFAPNNQAFIDAGLNIKNMTYKGESITPGILRNIMQYHIHATTKRKGDTGTGGLKTAILDSEFNRYGTKLPLSVDLTTNKVTGEVNPLVPDNSATILVYDHKLGTPNTTVVHKINKVLIPDLAL